MKNGRINQYHFSLVEMIVVIAIILLAVGIVLPKINAPAYITLRNAITRIKTVFLEASNRSLIQGKEVTVLVDGQKIYIVDDSKQNDDPLPVNNQFKEFFSYTVPNDITLKIIEDNKLETEEVTDLIEEQKEDEDLQTINKSKFTFYPDGSADGPQIHISLHPDAFLLKISPLTGVVNVKDLTEDDDSTE